MGEPDPVTLHARLLESVRRLAAPAAEQNACIAEQHFHHDELALELDDVWEAAKAFCDLSPEQISAVDRIDEQLSAMSGGEREELWTADGVASSPEWVIVRQLAEDALQRFDAERE